MINRSGFGWIELLEGILLIALGIFSFVRPGSILSGLVVVYGLLALCVGIADIIFYVKVEKHTGLAPTLMLICGVLSVLAGLMLLIYPGAAKWAMAIFFPMWFIAHCISRLSQLPQIRLFTTRGHYYFVMIINIIGLCLGVLMLIRPVAAIFSLSYLIGIYLILLGIDCVLLAVSRMGSDW